MNGAGVFKKKVSYPPLRYHLYHPDNSLVPSYAARAKPAARGHRTAVYNKGKAWGLGWGIWKPLAAAAVKAGVRFDKYTEVRQLVLDRSGAVVGVKALSIPAGSAAASRFARYIRRANWLLELLPPVIPLAAVTIGMARRYLAAAGRIEAEQRVTRFIRARRGVVLSAGGFILNSADGRALCAAVRARPAQRHPGRHRQRYPPRAERRRRRWARWTGSPAGA